MESRKLFVFTLLFLVAFNVAFTQDQSADKSAQMLFGTIVSIIIKWVFPILSLFCALYGVGRGIKKGEWDFAIMCIGAAIILAVMPSAIQTLFGADFGNAVKSSIGK